MTFLRSIFGSSQEDIWAELAQLLGGTFTSGGYFNSDEIRVQSGQWELVLDTYTEGSNSSSTTYTRMRAPFVNKDELCFKMYRTGMLSSLGTWLGMQDIIIGDQFFDERFIIKGNNEEHIRKLLGSKELRVLIQGQPNFSLEIDHDKYHFNEHFPKGVDVLNFSCYGRIDSPVALHDLFKLFSVFLNRLVHIDSAYADDPQIKLS